MMKKKNLDLEARFWSGSKMYSALGLMETFFQFNDLAAAKEMLSTMMQHAVKKNSRIGEEPSAVFHFYLSMRSLIRAGYLIRKQSKQGKLNLHSEIRSPLMQGSLREEEYRDSLRVFQKAFKAHSLQEFDGFMAGIVYFSLGSGSCETESSIVSPYLHLTKMLDAAWLLLERSSAEKAT